MKLIGGLIVCVFGLILCVASLFLESLSVIDGTLKDALQGAGFGLALALFIFTAHGWIQEKKLKETFRCGQKINDVCGNHKLAIGEFFVQGGSYDASLMARLIEALAHADHCRECEKYYRDILIFNKNYPKPSKS